jgi:hypothetical protein
MIIMGIRIRLSNALKNFIKYPLFKRLEVLEAFAQNGTSSMQKNLIFIISPLRLRHIGIIKN